MSELLFSANVRAAARSTSCRSKFTYPIRPQINLHKLGINLCNVKSLCYLKTVNISLHNSICFCFIVESRLGCISSNTIDIQIMFSLKHLDCFNGLVSTATVLPVFSTLVSKTLKIMLQVLDTIGNTIRIIGNIGGAVTFLIIYHKNLKRGEQNPSLPRLNK